MTTHKAFDILCSSNILSAETCRFRFWRKEGVFVMHYDFDEIIDRRGTRALNTDGFRSYIFKDVEGKKKFPFKDDEFIRMWVADMEFATPPEICRAMKERIDRRIFGYTGLYDDAYYKVFSGWCKKMYDWEFPQEELTFSSGVIPALYEIVEDLVKDDEKVLITTPSYGFFQHAAEYSGKEYVCSPLRRDGDGHYTIDFEDFAQKAADPKMKLVIWCNPHNPTGRVWTADELKRVADIVEENDLWIISDEIHCDLLRSGLRHIPMAKIMDTYEKLITCMSASKTFNMAGLMFSDIIIRDRKLRRTFVKRDKNVGGLNPISLAAHEAAYEHGGAWLKELREYLDGNFRYVHDFLAEKLPLISFEIPESTYLAWVDMNPYLSDIADISDFFANKAGVLLEGGDSLFVGNAKGFIRLNLAMPQSLIEEGLNRIYEAVRKHSGSVDD